MPIDQPANSPIREDARAPGSAHGEARGEAHGVARRIDHLGRIVIPSEYRRAFGIREGDLIDMTAEGDAIMLRRLQRSCVFCASVVELVNFKDQPICNACIDALQDDQPNLGDSHDDNADL